MSLDILKFVAIIAISFYVVYIVILYMNIGPSKNIEGLENGPESENSDSDRIVIIGEATQAKSRGENIKEITDTILVELKIPTYRKDYEQILINAEDYVNAKMLKLLVNTNFKPNSVETDVDGIVKLQTFKSALNDIMKYVDETNSTGLF